MSLGMQVDALRLLFGAFLHFFIFIVDPPLSPNPSPPPPGRKGGPTTVFGLVFLRSEFMACR